MERAKIFGKFGFFSQIDRQTNRRTDKASYRDARAHFKNEREEKKYRKDKSRGGR